MIDTHLHIGVLYYGEREITPEYLIEFMDKNDIEKAVLLPIENPETTSYYVTSDYVLSVASKYPDRFIPFCNVDPRRARVEEVIFEYKEKGCKGFGEILASLYVNDPKMEIIYNVCGQLNLPIVFDLSESTCIDEIGLPRFEKMIKKYPDTIFIGHGPHFWAEISGDVKSIGGYPDGKIEKEGAVIKLLSHYPNCYADISARSGYNAITRDISFGYEFLERFKDKLLFGTDLCHYGQEIPQPSFINNALRENKISLDCFKKITQENASRILNLGESTG